MVMVIRAVAMAMTAHVMVVVTRVVAMEMEMAVKTKVCAMKMMKRATAPVMIQLMHAVAMEMKAHVVATKMRKLDACDSNRNGGMRDCNGEQLEVRVCAMTMMMPG